MSEYVTQQQHSDFEKMIMAKLEVFEGEDKRQNTRIAKTEEWQTEMAKMQATLQQQGNCIERISKTLTEMKEQPAKRWESVVSYSITVIISLILGYLFNIIY